MTLSDKRQIVLEDMIDWLKYNADWSEIAYLLNEDWQGVKNMSESDIEDRYNSITNNS